MKPHGYIRNIQIQWARNYHIKLKRILLVIVLLLTLTSCIYISQEEIAAIREAATETHVAGLPTNTLIPTPTPTKTPRPTYTPKPTPTNYSNNENIIGAWLVGDYMQYLIIIKYENSNYYYHSLFEDGSGETKILTEKIINNETRLYENINNYYGDYMVIRENKALAFYDKEGLIVVYMPEDIGQVCFSFPYLCK